MPHHRTHRIPKRSHAKRSKSHKNSQPKKSKAHKSSQPKRSKSHRKSYRKVNRKSNRRTNFKQVRKSKYRKKIKGGGRRFWHMPRPLGRMWRRVMGRRPARTRSQGPRVMQQQQQARQQQARQHQQQQPRETIARRVTGLGNVGAFQDGYTEGQEDVRRGEVVPYLHSHSLDPLKDLGDKIAKFDNLELGASTEQFLTYFKEGRYEDIERLYPLSFKAIKDGVKKAAAWGANKDGVPVQEKEEEYLEYIELAEWNLSELKRQINLLYVSGGIEAITKEMEEVESRVKKEGDVNWTGNKVVLSLLKKKDS